MSENNLTIVSALVLVDQDGRVLICERPKGKFMEGFWEFPGGKLEKNETPENCLVREIKEEIGVNLKNVCFSPLTFSLNKYDNFNILLLLYICQDLKFFHGFYILLQNQINHRKKDQILKSHFLHMFQMKILIYLSMSR